MTRLDPAVETSALEALGNAVLPDLMGRALRLRKQAEAAAPEERSLWLRRATLARLELEIYEEALWGFLEATW